MKRLKPEKKRLIVSIIAVVLILAMVISVVAPFLSPVFADELNKSDITIEANIGFDGNVKVANTSDKTRNLSEFNIYIKNNSDKTFKGSVNVPIARASGKYEVMKSELELNPKEDKRLCFTSEINTIATNIPVVIKNEKDKTVNEEKIPVKSSRNDSVWVGLLSNSPERLTYLKASLLQGNELFINLDKNNFPKNKGTLDNLNVIFSNDFDFNSLTEEQREFIKAWVEKGGILVTSDSFKNELDSYTERKENADALQNIYDYSGALSEEDASYLDKISAYNYGLGKIYFNNFDIGRAELVNSIPFGGECLEISNYLDENNGGNIINSEISSRLAYFNDRMPIENDIVVDIILIVIFVYLAFVGFILYFILKKKDMLKKALWILPSSALALTLLIFISSFSTIYKRPQANVITVFEQNNSEKMNRIVSAIGVSSADKGDIKVELPKKITTYEYDGDDYYGIEDNNKDYVDFDSIEKEVEKGVGDDRYIKTFNNPKWSKLKLNAYYNESGVKGKIDADINVVDGALKGTITNNTDYDLYDVVFSCSDNGFVIEKLAKGESVNIGEGDYICKLDTTTSSIDNGVSTILTDGKRVTGNKNNNRLYELELRQDMVNSIVNNYPNSDSSIFYTLIGFNDENMIDDSILINNKEAILRNTNAFVFEGQIEYSSFLSGEVPEGIIEPEVENDNGSIDNGNLQIYDLSYPVLVSFKMPDNIAIDSFSFDLDSINSESKIYNNSDKKWEDLKDVYSSINAYSYLDDNNKILLQINSKGEDMISMPQIKVKLMQEGKEESFNAGN